MIETLCARLESLCHPFDRPVVKEGERVVVIASIWGTLEYQVPPAADAATCIETLRMAPLHASVGPGDRAPYDLCALDTKRIGPTAELLDALNRRADPDGSVHLLLLCTAGHFCALLGTRRSVNEVLAVHCPDRGVDDTLCLRVAVRCRGCRLARTSDPSNPGARDLPHELPPAEIG